MKAKLDGRWITVGKEGKILYDQSGYGRPVGGGLRLSPAEALYLVHRSKITVPGHSFNSLLTEFSEEQGFLRQYLVYRDIRERGYAVQTGPLDFRVFRRGHRPGKGESIYMVRVISERNLIDFGVLSDEALATSNMRKQHILAVVDDENEITYYEVKRPELGLFLDDSTEPEPAKAILAGRSAIVSFPPESLYDQAFFGKRLDDERIMLSPLEAVYLMRSGSLTLEHSGESVSAEQYLNLLEAADSEMGEKLKVYEALKKRGYIPKTGYKFGHHFRVYSGKKLHSEMLAHAIPEGSALPMNVISRSVRLAHSVKKKMLFACVNSEGIAYIEFARIKL